MKMLLRERGQDPCLHPAWRHSYARTLVNARVIVGATSPVAVHLPGGGRQVVLPYKANDFGARTIRVWRGGPKHCWNSGVAKHEWNSKHDLYSGCFAHTVVHLANSLCSQEMNKTTNAVILFQNVALLFIVKVAKPLW